MFAKTCVKNMYDCQICVQNVCIILGAWKMYASHLVRGNIGWIRPVGLIEISLEFANFKPDEGCI